MTEDTRREEAQRVIDALQASAGEIDNLAVLYSVKGQPMNVMFGYTRSTSVMWMLGAIEYARWHIFNLITMVRAQRAAEHEAMEDVVKRLKDENKLQ